MSGVCPVVAVSVRVMSVSGLCPCPGYVFDQVMSVSGLCPVQVLSVRVMSCPGSVCPVFVLSRLCPSTRNVHDSVSSNKNDHLCMKCGSLSVNSQGCGAICSIYRVLQY